MSHSQFAIEQLESRQMLTAMAEIAAESSLQLVAAANSPQNAAPAVTAAMLETNVTLPIGDPPPLRAAATEPFRITTSVLRPAGTAEAIIQPRRQLIAPSYASGGSASAARWRFDEVDMSALSKSARDGQNLPPHNISSQFAASRATPMHQAQWFVQQQGSWKFYSRFGSKSGVPVVGDFNGDQISEVGIYDAGQWFIDINGDGLWNQEDVLLLLGGGGDVPVVGDWNGDGRDDIGVFKTADNLHGRASGQHAVAGDFDGDGVATAGEFRDGRWRLKPDAVDHLNQQHANQQHADFVFGNAEDLPVVGDWNGDGLDDLGVYRQGKFILDTNGNRAMDAADLVFEAGDPGGLPIAGDFDGDGKDEPAVYRRQPPQRTARSND